MNNREKNVLNEKIIEELICNTSKSNEIAGLVNIKQWFYENYYGAKSPNLDKLETISIMLDVKSLGGKYWSYLSDSLDNEIWVRNILEFLENETEKGMILVVSSFDEFENYDKSINFTKVKFKHHTFVLIESA